MVLIDVGVGDVVRLRKPHPCGGYEWDVVRIGADIGLRCCKCDHRIMISRSLFNKRFKSFVRRATDSPEIASP